MHIELKLLFSALLFSFAGTANAYTTIECDLASKITPTANLKKVIRNPSTVIACTMDSQKVEVGFIGVEFTTPNEELKAGRSFTIQCVNDSPFQTYYYGGVPIGFQSSNYKHEHWFYNPKSGRCFFSGNESLLKGLVANTNSSGIAILPISDQL